MGQNKKTGTLHHILSYNSGSFFLDHKITIASNYQAPITPNDLIIHKFKSIFKFCMLLNNKKGFILQNSSSEKGNPPISSSGNDLKNYRMPYFE